MKRNKWLAGMLGLLLIGTVSFPTQAKDTDIREKTKRKKNPFRKQKHLMEINMC